MTLSSRPRAALPEAVVALAVTIVAVAAVMAAIALGIAQTARGEAEDSFFPRGRVDPRIVVLAIDQRAMESVRIDPVSVYQFLLTNASGVSAIVDPDVVNIARTQITESPRVTGVGGFDQALAAGLQSAKTAVLTIPNSGLSTPSAGSRIPMLAGPVQASVISAAAAANGLGVAAGNPAILRTVPLVAQTPSPTPAAQRSFVPSVALIGLIRAEHLPATFRQTPDGIDIGRTHIPTEGDTALRVNYSPGLLGPSPHVVSLADLLAGSFPSSRLYGKTILVGVTDPTAATMLRAPAGAGGRLPEVLVTANAVNTLLTRQFLAPPSDTAIVVTAVLLAGLTAVAIGLLPIWLSLLPPLLLGGLYWFYASTRFTSGQVVDVLYPLGAVAIAFVLAAGWKGFEELRRRRQVSQLFARYVPDTAARQLLEGGEADEIATGKRLDVAVLFCDLRGFTPLSATLAPNQVRRLLDQYYEVMTDIVFRHNGTLIQFIGDEVFAVFGAPLAMADHAPVALRCARDMLDAGPSLSTTLRSEGLPPCRYGIGLHTGEVVAAHVGSRRRRQYTVLGDTVNIGSRLCGQAGPSEIICSGDLFEAADGPPIAEPLGNLALKGVSRRVVGYRIRATPTPREQPIP
jgi:adenylate cyclase